MLSTLAEKKEEKKWIKNNKGLERIAVGDATGKRGEEERDRNHSVVKE